MKKIIAITLALVLCFGLCACGSSNLDSNGTTNKQDDAAQEYVGEWKANVLESFMNGVKTYKVAIIMLNADGTATYRGKDATWEYKDGTIHLEVTGGGVAVLGIDKEDGKTVLKFSEYTYYRASEFEEIDNVAALTDGKTELLVGNTYTTANGMVFTLEKAELITEGTECGFSLYFICDTKFEISTARYNSPRNMAQFSMQEQPNDGNALKYVFGASFDKAKVEEDVNDYGILSFIIDETEYYISVDAFFE